MLAGDASCQVAVTRQVSCLAVTHPTKWTWTLTDFFDDLVALYGLRCFSGLQKSELCVVGGGWYPGGTVGGERTALRWKMSSLPHGCDINGRMFVSARWVPTSIAVVKNT